MQLEKRIKNILKEHFKNSDTRYKNNCVCNDRNIFFIIMIILSIINLFSILYLILWLVDSGVLK